MMLADSRSPFGHAGSTMQQQNLLGLAGMGLPELQLLSNLGSLMGQQQFQEQQQEDDERGASVGGRTRSGDSRSSSAYASRHQAAEQRRRNRINERLDLLRKLVPHAERANTACFLEEVIRYVEQLRNRNTTLERMVKELQTGAAAGGMPAPPAVSAAAAPVANLQSLALPGASGAELQQPPAAAATAAVPGPAQSQVPAEQQAAAATATPTSAIAGPSALQQQTDPAAALAPAGAAASAPAGPAAAPSTSQALMGLQGLLPEGIDVQTLLQQALINAQMQLLQQHQQHQAALAAASSGGPAGSAGAAVSTGQQQQKLDQQPQQLQQSIEAPKQQQQPVLQPVLQSPPSLSLQPPGQPQPSILNTLSAGPASSAHTAVASGRLANIQQQQQLQQQPDMFTGAQLAASTISTSGGTTLPPELRKLKAQLDSQTGGGASADLAGLTAPGPGSAAAAGGTLQQQQQPTTSRLLTNAPNLALSTHVRDQGSNPAGSHSAAPEMGRNSASAGLSGTGSSKAHISNYHMDRSQLLAAAAAAANGVDDVNGAALMAELSAVAAAGAADNAAAIAVAERANSMASGHEEGEEGENTLPHKKRKMLVL